MLAAESARRPADAARGGDRRAGGRRRASVPDRPACSRSCCGRAGSTACAVVVVGAFTDCGPGRRSRPCCASGCAPLGVPMVSGFDFGHTDTIASASRSACPPPLDADARAAPDLATPCADLASPVGVSSWLEVLPGGRLPDRDGRAWCGTEQPTGRAAARRSPRVRPGSPSSLDVAVLGRGRSTHTRRTRPVALARIARSASQSTAPFASPCAGRASRSAGPGAPPQRPRKASPMPCR